MRTICLVAIPDDFQGLFYYRQEMSHLFCLMINGADSQDVWYPMLFVLLCVLEQPRVDNSSMGPKWEQLVLFA
jgi:hypothetical protein